MNHRIVLSAIAVVLLGTFAATPGHAEHLYANQVPSITCDNNLAFPDTIMIRIDRETQSAAIDAGVVSSDGTASSPWYRIQENKVSVSSRSTQQLLEIVDSDTSGRQFALMIDRTRVCPGKERCFNGRLRAVNQTSIGDASDEMARGIGVVCFPN